MCDDLENISPLPNPKPYAGALWHSQEQFALGVLALKWKQEGRLPAEWPLYAWGDVSFDSKIVERKVRPPTPAQRLLYRIYRALPHLVQKGLLAAASRISPLIRGLAGLRTMRARTNSR